MWKYYVYRGCAPSRSSFQSGRYPINVGLGNDDGVMSPNHGIPRGMTLLPEKLKTVGYATYLIGKWDAGMATFDHLPSNRGYDYFWGYLGKTIDYFNASSYNDCPNIGDVDLWENDHPAFMSKEDAAAEGFVEFQLRDRALDILDDHAYGGDKYNEPFFLVKC